MPVDADGNRADIIMDSYARINRMNIGGLYEQYVNGASRDVGKHICKLFNINHGEKHARTKVEEIYHNDKTLFDVAYKYLLGYYKIVSPKMYTWYSCDVTEEEMIEHFTVIVQDFVYLYVPPESSPEPVEMVKLLEKHYRPTFGPVSYVGYGGRKVITKNPVRIASVYFMLLEKTADDWSATSSGKVQHFGVPAQLSKADKFSNAIRAQPVKFMGETEGRIVASYSGPVAVAEICDRNNNTLVHKHMAASILKAPEPNNIKRLINRKEFPYGSSSPLQHINHMALCGGWQFEYQSVRQTFKL